MPGETQGKTWGDTLGERFATRPNALNAVRLLLAVEVLVWHAYSLRGSSWLPAPVEALLSDVGVDSFFAVSGFLLCGAWARRPSLGAFLAARARRILPGLWVCLLVTAFVAAPVAAVLGDVAAPSAAGQVGYVLGNADTWVSRYGIEGRPTGLPRTGVWNGSLWSLGYEVWCYLLLAALGVTRLLRARVVAGVAVGCWSFGLLLVSAEAPTAGLPWLAARCGLMFSVGALLWFHRDRVPMSDRLAAGAAALVPLAALTGSYRSLAAPAVAYLCIWAALRLGARRRWVLRHDLSFGVYLYGFPVQQALLACGVSLGWAGFSLLSLACTLPLAAASWFLVERPASRRRTVQPVTPAAVGAVATPAAA